MADEGTETITVRVEPAMKKELISRAKREDKDLSQYVREVYFDHLYPPKHPLEATLEKNFSEMKKINQQLIEMRRDHALSTEAILLYGQEAEPEEVMTWVRTHLHRE